MLKAGGQPRECVAASRGLLRLAQAVETCASVALLVTACAPAPTPAAPAPLPSSAGEHPAMPARPARIALPDTGGYRGRFNNNDQHHADLCVRLRVASAPLRYPDGSPTGFELTPGKLVPQPGSGVWCPQPGMARLDARELVLSVDGRPMLFHRGGWGFLGQDPRSAVHYGHVLVSDLDTIGLRYQRPARGTQVPYAARWKPAPLRPWIDQGQRDGNGSACADRSRVPERVVVRSIPGDMRYLNSARTRVIPYAIYGDPSQDLGPAADRARGIRYTMLEWSWINVRGGGVARALVPDGDEFYRCADVPPIRLAAVANARTRQRTGWVEAVYGAVRAGRGQWLYGWIVSAHRHGSEPVVRHLVPEPPARDSLSLPLWPGRPPGSGDDGGPDRGVQRPPDPVRGPISRITVSRPTLTLYPPLTAAAAAPAILVLPGGGYRYLAIDIEGTDVCRWLTGQGIACVLVKYRVPQPAGPARYLLPLQDVQRAMGLVRLHAADWGIDPGRVGVLGFSAGANLAAILGSHRSPRAYPPLDDADRESARPDFAMLLYPAYLVADRRKPGLAPEVRPTSATPPTFLVQAEDDPIGVDNSLFYALALRGAGVRAELHMYATGGHGFGLRTAAGEAAIAWPELALRWLASLGITSRPAPPGPAGAPE